MSKTNSTKESGFALDTVAAARQSARNLAQSMSSKLDDLKPRSAEALQSGAAVRNASQTGSAAMAKAGAGVADKLDAASTYVADSNARNLAGDLRRTVSRHPAGFLIMAAAFGFWAGSVLSRARGSGSTTLAKEELE